MPNDQAPSHVAADDRLDDDWLDDETLAVALDEFEAGQAAHSTPQPVYDGAPGGLLPPRSPANVAPAGDCSALGRPPAFTVPSAASRQGHRLESPAISGTPLPESPPSGYVNSVPSDSSPSDGSQPSLGDLLRADAGRRVDSSPAAATTCGRGAPTYCGIGRTVGGDENHAAAQVGSAAAADVGVERARSSGVGSGSKSGGKKQRVLPWDTGGKRLTARPTARPLQALQLVPVSPQRPVVQPPGAQRQSVVPQPAQPSPVYQSPLPEQTRLVVQQQGADQPAELQARIQPPRPTVAQPPRQALSSIPRLPPAPLPQRLPPAAPPAAPLAAPPPLQQPVARTSALQPTIDPAHAAMSRVAAASDAPVPPSVAPASAVAAIEGRSIEAVGERLRLPDKVVHYYREEQRVSEIYEWQAACLFNEEVQKGRNLVFSTPTSSGKTLVAEMLVCRAIGRRKKALLVLPYVSLVEENTARFSRLLSNISVPSVIKDKGSGRTRLGAPRKAVVQGCHGSRGGAGFEGNADLVVCTFEKTAAIINRLQEEDRLSELGLLVVDEVHFLEDPNRGYILECLLSKMLYLRSRAPRRAIATSSAGGASPLQVVAMSATLQNPSDLSDWLDAVLHVSNDRPVTLTEYVKQGHDLYRFDVEHNALKYQRQLRLPPRNELRDPHRAPAPDPDDVGLLCSEVLVQGGDTLVFCPARWQVEQTAREVADFLAGLNLAEVSVELRARREKLLRKVAMVSSVHMDLLSRLVPVGVGIHHAGLSHDERFILERGFRDRAIKVLCCTSTLAAGVNLPARRVVFRSATGWMEQRSNDGSGGGSGNGNGNGGGNSGRARAPDRFITLNAYRQMSGRAGRAGMCTSGESVLIVRSDGERQHAERLMQRGAQPLVSCLLTRSHAHVARRLALEMVASGLAQTGEQVDKFVEATFGCCQARARDRVTKEAREAAAEEEEGREEEAARVPATTHERLVKQWVYDAIKWLRGAHAPGAGRDGGRAAPAEQLVSWDGNRLSATPAGRAVYLSTLQPEDGVSLLSSLRGAMERLITNDDLHLVWMLTPERDATATFREVASPPPAPLRPARAAQHAPFTYDLPQSKRQCSPSDAIICARTAWRGALGGPLCPLQVAQRHATGHCHGA